VLHGVEKNPLKIQNCKQITTVTIYFIEAKEVEKNPLKIQNCKQITTLQVPVTGEYLLKRTL